MYVAQVKSSESQAPKNLRHFAHRTVELTVRVPKKPVYRFERSCKQRPILAPSHSITQHHRKLSTGENVSVVQLRCPILGLESGCEVYVEAPDER
jgi:hypothetical protein